MSDNRDRLLDQAETLGLSREEASRLFDAFFACVRDEVREATAPKKEPKVIRDASGEVIWTEETDRG